MNEYEDFPATRFRTPGELLAVYQAHERFLHRRIRVPSQEEIDRAIETDRLFRAWKEADQLRERWI